MNPAEWARQFTGNWKPDAFLIQAEQNARDAIERYSGGTTDPPPAEVQHAMKALQLIGTLRGIIGKGKGTSADAWKIADFAFTAGLLMGQLDMMFYRPPAEIGMPRMTPFRGRWVPTSAPLEREILIFFERRNTASTAEFAFACWGDGAVCGEVSKYKKALGTVNRAIRLADPKLPTIHFGKSTIHVA